jgi:hypothetical protein
VSAIASFMSIPKSALDGLRDAATPKKNWRGKIVDNYPSYLAAHAREVATYPWSGYVLATLLPFLEEQGIDLMASEFDDLAADICKARQTTCFLLTDAHKNAYLERLKVAPFSEDQLRDYYNEFNGCAEPEAGRPMLDGIAAFRQSLESVDAESAVVFAIG